MDMQYKRSKKLIDSRLQFRLIGVFLCVSVAASLFQLVLLNQAMIGLSEELTREGDKVLARASDIVTMQALWTAAVLLPLTVLAGILITYRVAGPAYRMRQHCRAIARGERPEPCRIRQNDELQDLCAAMNEALDAAFLATPRAEASEDLSLAEAETLVRVGTEKEEEAEASSSCEG